MIGAGYPLYFAFIRYSVMILITMICCAGIYNTVSDM